MNSFQGQRNAWCVAAIVASLGASCGYNSYRGDGVFTDHGWYSGSQRYRLDLGAVDLTTRAVRHYEMVNLPTDTFAIGLGFPSAPRSRGTDTRIATNAVVHLKVTSASGTLIDEKRALSEWVVSGSFQFSTFLCCRGSGNTWSEETGTAWGCIFKPKAGERYLVTLEVVEPVPGAPGFNSVPRLFVEGGPPDFLP